MRKIEKWEIESYRAALFLLSFGSFSHDINLETIIVLNLYLKLAKALAL